MVGIHTYVHLHVCPYTHTHTYTHVYMTRGEPPTRVTRHRLSLGSCTRWRASGGASTPVPSLVPAGPPWTSSAGPQAGERLTFQQKQSGRRPLARPGPAVGLTGVSGCLIPCQPLKAQECCSPKATCSWAVLGFSLPSWL